MTVQVQDSPPAKGERPPSPNRRRRRVADRYTPLIAANGFTPVANIFLEWYARLVSAPGRPGITNHEAMLLIHLLSFKWDALAPYPRLGTLAKRMGMQKRSVRAMLARLEERGLLQRVRGPNAAVNRFDLSGLFTALEGCITGEAAPAKQLPEGAPAAPAKQLPDPSTKSHPAPVERVVRKKKTLVFA